MASSRADEVAEILWELKRADKISTYSMIARRAGFSAGSNGRAILSCLKTVRRDWPHLQWWRAVQDDGCLEAGSEQESLLREAGYALEEAAKAGALMVKELEAHLLKWEAPEKPVAAAAAESSAAV
jgi:alkylated DNA nucleotide flippase Atl1